jgi:hypothetical protein
MSRLMRPAYMITWGWFDRKAKWRKGQLIARDLSPSSETTMKAAWMEELTRIANAAGIEREKLRLFHWGIPQVPFPDLNWCDVLDNVIHEENVAAKGAFDFGLAEMARAFHDLGLIPTALPNLPAVPTGPLSAMAGAWWSAAEAARLGCSLGQTDVMKAIALYTEKACQSMMEILTFIRHRASTALSDAA